MNNSKIVKELRTKLEEARKQKNKEAVTAYSVTLSSIQQADAKSKNGLSESKIIDIIKNEIQIYKEIEDLPLHKKKKVKETARNIQNILSEFIPPEPDPIEESKYDSIITDAINVVGITNMNPIMSHIKEKYGKGVDMKVMAIKVRDRISSNNG